jgi:hypothetical protein
MKNWSLFKIQYSIVDGNAKGFKTFFINGYRNLKAMFGRNLFANPH